MRYFLALSFLIMFPAQSLFAHLCANVIENASTETSKVSTRFSPPSFPVDSVEEQLQQLRIYLELQDSLRRVVVERVKQYSKNWQRHSLEEAFQQFFPGNSEIMVRYESFKIVYWVQGSDIQIKEDPAGGYFRVYNGQNTNICLTWDKQVLLDGSSARYQERTHFLYRDLSSLDLRPDSQDTRYFLDRASNYVNRWPKWQRLSDKLKSSIRYWTPYVEVKYMRSMLNYIALNPSQDWIACLDQILSNLKMLDFWGSSFNVNAYKAIGLKTMITRPNSRKLANVLFRSSDAFEFLSASHLSKGDIEIMEQLAQLTSRKALIQKLIELAENSQSPDWIPVLQELQKRLTRVEWNDSDSVQELEFRITRALSHLQSRQQVVNQ